MLILVCGYRGTGKDTLYKQFINQLEFNWIILKHPKINKRFIIKPSGQLSFAAKLKQEVLTYLGLPSSFDIEQFKNNTLQTIEQVTGLFINVDIDKTRTLRDYFIDYGETKRLQYPYHWCQQTLENINPKDDYMITDWRFKAEYDFINNLGYPINTIRVYRHDVHIPPLISSEHDLDYFQTDFVLIPRFNYELEIKSLLNVFPQYQDYIKIN